MQAIMTPHQNSEGLAKGLLPYIQTALPSSTCRPWNRYEFQETEWLLSPVHEFPLYRACKYYTDMLRDEDPTKSELVAGIYVEKGFTGDAAKMNKSNECMDSKWGWHKVVQSICSGEIPAILNDFIGKHLAPIDVLVSGGYDSNTYGSYRLRLLASEDGAQFDVQTEQSTSLLAAFESVTSWTELVTTLETIMNDDWLWVDMYIRVHLSLKPRIGTVSKAVWTDQQLWSEFMEPFLPCVTRT